MPTKVAKAENLNPEAVAICTFKNLLNTLREIDPEFPIQYAICLCEIYENEGISLTDLADRSSLALSTTSRIIAALSKYRPNGQSYEMVELRVCEHERRRKEIYLTKKGKKLLKSVESLLS